jgi:DNA-directed RNA polymerase specialized sigma24 family protein
MGRAVDRFAPYVHAVATEAFGLSGDDARDVFQDVFVQTWSRVNGPEAGQDLHAWVTRTTRAVSEGRRGELEAPTEDALRRLDDALTVRESVRRLSAADRELALLPLVDGRVDPASPAVGGRDPVVVADEVQRVRKRVLRDLSDGRRRRSAR